MFKEEICFPKVVCFVAGVSFCYTHNLGKVFPLKEETLQIESEKLARYD
ncbi:hypothetical protein [Bacillus tropicus]|nr:hypothetical protein [Bacillus tropicus]EEL25769.1 hypothetical protein bcere0018_52470 [Bacillus cereus Rock1-15]KZD47933.1 hypothetical protein B4085_4024 [Bacillus cereus]KZD54210.1 hypothetical protein B4116_5620 [Bacillus cereus]MCU4952584.1 hypothetical protein [Bacillus paranthracis]